MLWIPLIISPIKIVVVHSGGATTAAAHTAAAHENILAFRKCMKDGAQIVGDVLMKRSVLGHLQHFSFNLCKGTQKYKHTHIRRHTAAVDRSFHDTKRNSLRQTTQQQPQWRAKQKRGCAARNNSYFLAFILVRNTK